MSESASGDLLRSFLDAAQGRVPCDLLVRGARVLNVFAGRWQTANVWIHHGHVVALDDERAIGIKAKQTIDAKGKAIVPGFIDAHVHIESSLLIPYYFEQAVLKRGTTGAICDPHELANVQGVSGIRYFLDAATELALDLRVMLSSCVPATTHLETNGAGTLSAKELLPLASHPRALGLAEVMNVPGVLGADPIVFDKLIAFQNRPIDGHSPLLTGPQLSAYAACGISSCHESSEAHEAREKLFKGIAIWIREGSVAKDLDRLIEILDASSSASVGFCTDDRNPLDIATQGHLDYMIRTAIKRGVPAEVAYRSASWTVARHYGLKRVGAVAPGYRADLVLLNDADTCMIDRVFKSGVDVSALNLGAPKLPHAPNTIRAKTPQAVELEGPSGNVHVIHVHAGKIITDRTVESHDAPGVARLSVLERHGHGMPPANAYVRGFGERFSGAIASSVGHDSHNLIVAGSNTEDMSTALATLIECGGGFSVVKDKKVLARLELPFGGLMSLKDPKFIESDLRRLHEASRSIGCELEEPFLQLAFLSLPVIPKLKLTNKGLVDVDRFEIISVRA